MLRVVIISRDVELTESLKNVLAELSHVAVLRTVNGAPNGLQLTRLLRAHAPDVLFVGVDDMSYVRELTQSVEASAPGLPLVAVHRTCSPELLLDVMRTGIREFLSAPFQINALAEILSRIRDIQSRRPQVFAATDLTFAFLPAKAGVGASTIALNAAFAVSRIPDTQALLVDFDLNSGMARFMLKLDNAYSLLDAAEHAAEMDENLWPQLVSSFDSLDILHAGTINPNYRLEPVQLRHLLTFVRRNYNVICADLSGNMERYSIEVMHESKRIFLVCTPEIPSLYLASEKYKYLQKLELADRVSLIVNRVNKRDLISRQEIEQVIGLPVQFSFINDYQAVHKSVTVAKPVDPVSALGRQYSALAHSMLSKPVPKLLPQKRKFVEFFTVAPVRSTQQTR